jgi:hypothetical protein
MATSEPSKDLIPVQTRRTGGEQGAVRAVLPAQGVLPQAMVFGIALDVDDDLHQLRLTPDEDPAKRPLEQSLYTARIELEGAGIRVEHVAKNPARRAGEFGFRVLESHQQVEVIGQQAIREGVGVGRDPFLVELQEVPRSCSTRKMFSRLLPRLQTW